MPILPPKLVLFADVAERGTGAVIVVGAGVGVETSSTVMFCRKVEVERGWSKVVGVASVCLGTVELKVCGLMALTRLLNGVVKALA
jgi:uncharacterized membrane protein